MATSCVYVLATSTAGTRSALQAAKAMADTGNARVVLLVPRVVSFALDLNDPGDDPVAIADEYRVIAAAAGVDASVRVCFCRETAHVFSRLLIEGADVIVSGQRRRWWPSSEERLAGRLSAEGHRVTFVDVNREPSAGLAHAQSMSVRSV